ncbi:rCG24511 [Rattus norvegicus]|uniref:RCG24511 n=1 Tax=Rattus norvegicus TaxID=10116 RepID=A6K6S2_RAT|nr:rCG24511 [Rattus norvegicus]
MGARPGSARPTQTPKTPCSLQREIPINFRRMHGVDHSYPRTQ